MQCFPKNLVINERYQVVSPLGEGAMSAVYLVRDLQRPGALWALKELKQPQGNQEEREMALELFRREGSILASLNHPGLPRLIDFCGDGQHNYLVMERVKGNTLDTILGGRVQPLRPEEAIPIALQAAHVIAYLHAQNPPVIFRDLKPSNIMLTPSGRVRFIDFGIARFFDAKQGKDTQELGTPGFCAPEQYSGHSNLSSDIYSLGVTLYYLLTLKDPQSFNFKFPPLSEINPDAPPGLDPILAKCLELDSSQRCQSASQLAHDLFELLRTMDHAPNASTRSLESALLSLSHHYKYVKSEGIRESLGFWWSWIKTIWGPLSKRPQ